MSEDSTKRFDGKENGEKLTQILAIVQNLDTRVGSIEGRLGSLEQKVEQRLYDTRPIWEKVQIDIAQVRIDISHLSEGQEHLRGEAREIKTQLRDFDRKFNIFNDTPVTIQADYRDIYDRLREIERQRA